VTKYKMCRCGERYPEDAGCPHGCPPPGKQPRRRRSVGVKPDNSFGPFIRDAAREACKRLGLHTDSWRAYGKMRRPPAALRADT
jgi:hypothetical protein